jgi:hypothetical protein
MFNREKAIQELISLYMDELHYDNAYFTDMLTKGFVGFNNMSDEELMAELEDRDVSYLFVEE